MNEQIGDGSHRHGNTPQELAFTVPLTVEQTFLAIQDEEYRRHLVQRAVRQGGLAVSWLSSGKGTLRVRLNCVDGTVKVSFDAQLKLA